MKYILCVLVALCCFNVQAYDSYVNPPVQYIVPQPVVVTQTMVYQTQYYTVTVPVPVVNLAPYPVVYVPYWTYPYTVYVPQPQRRCWFK